MTIRILSAGLAAAFFAVAAIHPAVAQDKPAVAQEKKVTPQQQKMKDCAGKWKEEKATKKVSGRAAYRTFMSSCLKS